MARRLGAALRLRPAARMHATATCRRPTAPASSRSTWRAIAACATASPSTGSAAPSAPCATASRAQVSPTFAASTAPAARARPAELGAGARGRPGDVNQIRAAVQFARAQRRRSAPRRPGDPRRLLAGRRLLRLPPGPAAAGGTLDYRIRPVAFPTRYMLHGWFDHRAHQIVQRPGQRRLEGSAACLSCHTRRRVERSSDLLLPDLASCRDLPWRRDAPACRCHRPARCATITIWTAGAPAMLLRQQVRGRRWAIDGDPRSQPAAPARRGRR